MLSTSLRSRIHDFEAFIDFHVIDSITNNLPTHRISLEPLLIPHTINSCLADPRFNEPASIDILLGAEIFFELLTGESLKFSPFITLHNTTLGWVFTGSTQISDAPPTSTSLTLRHGDQSAVSLISQSYKGSDSSDSTAEEHFKANVYHDDHGRFVVRLPFIQDPSSLGDSKCMAQQRFYNLERKLHKSPSLASDYQKFMDEYLELNHMELAHKTDGPTYYLPHHSVFKSNSLTTKMCVVFDGSANTRSGHSLNDILLRGPKVQPDLISIILRFRT